MIETNWLLKTVAEEHNELNKSYFDKNIADTNPAFLILEMASRYMDILKTPQTILDIGCGAAWQAVYLKKQNILRNSSYTGCF